MKTKTVMKNSLFLSSQGAAALWCGFFWLSALPTLLAQSAPDLAKRKQLGPKNVTLMVIGYEMDKARADAILQKQDMTQDVKAVVGKLETLSKSQGAAHAACAAQIIRSGQRSTLETESVKFEFEGILSATGETLNLSMTRTGKTSGVTTQVRASLETAGGYAFIGTEPDVKPGKDLMLFMRCIMHYVE